MSEIGKINIKKTDISSQKFNQQIDNYINNMQEKYNNEIKIETLDLAFDELSNNISSNSSDVLENDFVKINEDYWNTNKLRFIPYKKNGTYLIQQLNENNEWVNMGYSNQESVYNYFKKIDSLTSKVKNVGYSQDTYNMKDAQLNKRHEKENPSYTEKVLNEGIKNVGYSQDTYNMKDAQLNKRHEKENPSYTEKVLNEGIKNVGYSQDTYNMKDAQLNKRHEKENPSYTEKVLNEGIKNVGYSQDTYNMKDAQLNKRHEKENPSYTEKVLNEGIKNVGYSQETYNMKDAQLNKRHEKENLSLNEVTHQVSEVDHKGIYKLLTDVSTDESKFLFWGDNTTVGLEGQKLDFDKKITSENGNITYYKNNKMIKMILKDKVLISLGDTEIEYFKDGSHSVQLVSAEKKDYYNVNGIKIKTEENFGYSKGITYYNEDGSKYKYEEKSTNGDIYISEWKDGIKITTHNGILWYTENEKLGLRTFYKDGKVEKEEFADKTIHYEKNDTIKIVYKNGVSEKYKNKKLISKTDKNGITAEYIYLNDGDKVEFIDKNEDGKAILTYYKGDKIQSQTIGKRNGSSPSSDGEVMIPNIEGKTINYDENGTVLSENDGNGITIGKGYKEYDMVIYGYENSRKIFEDLGLQSNFSQGIDKFRINYDENGNLKNVACSGDASLNNGDTDKITEIYYPNGNCAKTTKRYDSTGNFMKEIYYLRDSTGKILKHYEK